MKKRSTKRSAKAQLPDVPMLTAIFYIMLAELSPISRRKLLELPASELRKISGHWRAEAAIARRRAA